MKKMHLPLWLSVLLLAGLISGCGGSGGSSETTAGTPTAVSSGVAVDPYIVNAQFEEIAADGSRVIQFTSTPSDSRGRFRFANPVQEGSIIRIKSSARGLHGNAPYAGILKRQVRADDGDAVVVSPLTTVMANGMTDIALLDLLETAGVRGLQLSDLTADPMAGLTGVTGGVTEADLRLLQANMAVNTLMLALDDYNYAGGPQSAVNLADCYALSREILDPVAFETMAGSISADLGGSFIFDDMASAAVEVQRTVVSQLRQELASDGGPVSSLRFGQLRDAATAELQTIARDMCATRLGEGGAPISAETLFTDNCAGCHTFGSGSGALDLAGDGSLLDGRFGGGKSHNGRTLNADELIALADYFNASTPVEPPPAPQTGGELYASECQGCHGSLTTTDISDRTAAGISSAIGANVGGMGNLALSPEQIALIADALPAMTQPPAPVPGRTGVEVFDQECAGCHALGSHDATGSIDLAAKGSVIVARIESGHMGKSLTAAELSSLADFADTFAVAPPPVVPRSAETVYNDNCAACHMLSGHDDSGNIDLAGLGDIAVTKVAGGHGGSVSTDELTGFAAWLDTFNPPPPPVVPRDGETVYNQNCAACHKLYGYDTVGNIDLAGRGDTTLTKLTSGHGGTVSLEEQLNLTNWLDTWAPAPPPVVDRNGETVYSQNCAGCHKVYGYDASGNVDLAGQGSLTVTKLGTGHGGTVTSGEVTNLANWLDTWTPAPPPVVARGGQDVYDDDCAGCHLVNGYDGTGSIDLAGNGSGAVTRLNSGHNGITLMVEERDNLAAWLDTFQAGDPYAGSCNSCHGQPPVMDAHEVHTSLARVGTDCAVCHDGAGHNGTVDLSFPATWDAKSGAAGSNGSSCSNVRCHGGQTTPDWNGGSLNSSTQCKSCHVFGTTQYNGYVSGEHRKHAVDKRYDCLVCHDAGKLANGHFQNLSTISFEQSPATTIKSSLSYSNGTCQTAGCHGSERW